MPAGTPSTVTGAATIAVGEVGLSGDLRPVSALGRRLAEAARLGLRRAIVPQASFETLDQVPAGMTVLPAVHVAQAAELALGPAEDRPGAANGATAALRGA